MENILKAVNRIQEETIKDNLVTAQSIDNYFN